MVQTKFEDHRNSGSRDEDFGHVTWTIYINFRSPFQMRLHMKLLDWQSGFREEDD